MDVSQAGVSHAAILFAIAVGFTAAGIIGSLWQLAFDEVPMLSRLLDPYPTFLTPFRVLAIVFAAPTTVLLRAFSDMINRPILGIPVLAASLVWSFFEGVFILTQVFGIT
ncbi:MAG: hypothetical protein U1E15_02875 [Hyphomicrobiales bacterium]